MDGLKCPYSFLCICRQLRYYYYCLKKKSPGSISSAPHSSLFLDSKSRHMWASQMRWVKEHCKIISKFFKTSIYISGEKQIAGVLLPSNISSLASRISFCHLINLYKLSLSEWDSTRLLHPSISLDHRNMERHKLNLQPEKLQHAYSSFTTTWRTCMNLLRNTTLGHSLFQPVFHKWIIGHLPCTRLYAGLEDDIIIDFKECTRPWRSQTLSMPVICVGECRKGCRSSLKPGPGLLKAFLREKDQGKSWARSRS